MVSKASVLLPEPERPVITTSLSRGMVTSIFFRLCSRAPLTMIASRGTRRLLGRAYLGSHLAMYASVAVPVGAGAASEPANGRGAEDDGRLRSVPPVYPSCERVCCPESSRFCDRITTVPASFSGGGGRWRG